MGELDKKDLKTELDNIDNSIFNYAYDNLLNSKLRILIGMWEKGKAISKYKGGKFTYYEIEKETGRPHQSLKKWHELYEDNRDKEKYIQEKAIPLAKRWAEKIMNKLLTQPKSISETAQRADNIQGDITIQVEPGDKIKLGNHILYCGDSYKMNIDADAIITDPPYGIKYEPNWKKWDGSPTTFKKITGDTEPFKPLHFMRYKTMLFFGANYYNQELPVGGWLVWDKRTDEIKDKMIGSPFELAWFISEHTEKKAIIKRILHGGVVNADSEKGNNEKRYISTQKPVALMEAILNDITIENDIIYDPFAGSGSTLLACEITNRKCITVEIEPENCSIIISRWEKLTGKEAQWMQE